MSTPEPPPNSGESTPDAVGGLPSYGSVPPPPEAPGDGGLGSVPPPPPPPPAPPSYGPAAFAPPDAIAWGWRRFGENVGPVLLAMLAMLGISIAMGILAGILTGFRGGPMTPGTMEFSARGPGELVANLLQWVVSTFLMGVAAKAALEVTEGKPFDFFGAFKKVNLVRLLVASVLVGIAVVIGFVLLVVPGLVVLFLTYLTTYSLVDDDKSPIDAIKHSVQLVSSNVGDSLLLAILNILVIIAGVVALCVGLFVAIPVTVFATAYAYRSFNGQPVTA